MGEFKGTPGPWRVGRQNNIQTAHESPLDWKGIAQYMGSGKEAEANARLIAAAPALLEALQWARDELAGLPRSLGYAITHLPKIDAAIRQATEGVKA